MPDEPDVTVFISYRRADTSADAGRLYDALRRRFGRDSVFMDVDSIRPGQDWVEAVEDAVGRCDALLALIGPDWSDVRDENGNRRLEDEFDRVRLEIEAALKADKAVIPILFEGAHVPAASELPESLRPLVRRNATRLSHATFDNDMRGLLRALRTIARAKAPAAPPVTAAAPVVAAAAQMAAPPPVVAAAPVVAPPPRVVPPAPPPVEPPAPVYYPRAQPTPPPAAAYYAPAQPYPGGAGRGGGNRPLLLLGGGLIALVVIGLLAWALLGNKAPTPTPSPTTEPTPTTVITPAPTDTPLPTASATPAATDTPTPGPTDTATAGPTPSEVPTAAVLDFHQAPSYGEVNLAAGFTPDPLMQSITAGGVVDVSYLGDNCRGFAASPPDFRVQYSAGGSALLRFYFIADTGADTTLIINDASGNWFCSDDTFQTLNPGIDYSQPVSGEYDIWVGSISGEFIPGTLYVTELDSNHP